MKSDCNDSTYLAAKQRIAALAATLAVGDVLHEVISWENTGNLFFQVVSIDDQTISYRRLNIEMTSEIFGCGFESPIVDSFADEVITRNDKRWLGRFQKWNGQPARFTYAN